MSRSKNVFIVVMVVLLIVSVAMVSGCTPSISKADPVPEKQAEQEQPDQNSEETSSGNEEPIEEESQEENVVYISASKLNVRAEAQKNAEILDSLIKGTGVKIVEEKADESGEPWYRISYEIPNGEVEGWILSTYTVKDRVELLSESLR